jgi:hypothetical protein
MQPANELIRKFSEGDSRRWYMDAAQAMRGLEGKLRQERFIEDRLHLSAAGYRSWSDLLRPYLEIDAER